MTKIFDNEILSLCLKVILGLCFPKENSFIRLECTAFRVGGKNVVLVKGDTFFHRPTYK